MLKKIVFLFVFVSSFFFCSAFADDLYPIPTFNPDPEQGYEDYLSLISELPLLPTPAPTPDPTPLPYLNESFDYSVIYSDSDITPNPFSPNLTPVPQRPFSITFTGPVYNFYRAFEQDGRMYYQRGNSILSVIPKEYIDMMTYVNNRGYQPKGSLPILNAGNSTLNSASDYFVQYFQIVGVTGMPRGYTYRFSLDWNNLFCYSLLPDTNYTFPDGITASVNVRVQHPDFTYSFFDFSCSLDDLYNGVAFDIVLPNDMVAAEHTITIRNTAVTPDGLPQPIYFSSASSSCLYVNFYGYDGRDMSGVNAIYESTNIIGGFFEGLLSGILKIIVPDAPMIKRFIDQHVQSVDGSPLSPAIVVTTRLLSIFMDPSDDPPVLAFDGYNLNISGSSVELIPPFRVDFSIIPQNLLTYSRMVGDLWLAWAFVKYISRKAVKLFNLKFMDTVNEIEPDGSNPNMFDGGD